MHPIELDGLIKKAVAGAEPIADPVHPLIAVGGYDGDNPLPVRLYFNDTQAIAAQVLVDKETYNRVGMMSIDISDFLTGGWPLGRNFTHIYLYHKNGKGFVDYGRVEDGKFWIVGGWHPTQQADGAIAAIKKAIRDTRPDQKEIGKKFLAQYQERLP